MPYCCFVAAPLPAYWFETGTPTFLLETLLARGVSALALDDMLGSGRIAVGI